MERISELLTQEYILLELKSKEKIEVIRELAQLLIDKGLIDNVDDFFQAILKRENLESTGIGHGVAIPHARTKSVKNLILAFGRSEQGVDFSSLDGKPSHLVFLIAAPEDQKSEYILTLARLSKLLRRDDLRNRLLSAHIPSEILTVISQAEV
jgi:PTS system fructose-specific IIC component